MQKNLVLSILATIACINLTGCVSLPSYEDKGDRYAEANYVRPGLWEPSGGHFELCHTYPTSLWHSSIWPDTFGIRVTNEVAVFIANKTDYPPDPGDRDRTDQRVFAVRWPEMPMDITDEVLWRCAQQPGPQLYATPGHSLVGDIGNPHLCFFPLIETNGVLEFYVGGLNPGQTVHLDWELVPDIMREVKEKGVVRKDPVEHTSYIEKVFESQIPK
jgi:hypothetical protein